MEVLLLHPWCEAAVSRGLHEDVVIESFSDYKKTQLFTDVILSCRTLVHWMKEKDTKLKVRLYKTLPACFLLVFNDVCFLEQYHFGTVGRASGKVPIAEIRNVLREQSPGSEGASTYYGELAGHFDHVWETADGNDLDKAGTFLAKLEEPDEAMLDAFRSSVLYTRPDLGAQREGKQSPEPEPQQPPERDK